jgi:hypothetical protein
MSVEHKYSYNGTNTGWGRAIHTWVKTLSAEEQAEFSEAAVRNDAIADSMKDLGYYTIAGDGSKVWTSNEVFLEHINNMCDPQWKSYWDRWRTENSIDFVATVHTS